MNNPRTPPGIESYRPGQDTMGPPGNPQPSPGSEPPARGRRPAPPRRTKRRRASGIGSVVFYLAIGLLVLAGAGLAVLLVAPPTDFLRQQVIAQVKAGTGRDLKIAGDTGLSFYPGLGFSMSDVSLSPPAGMEGPPFVRMKNLTVQVKLLPLLARTVSVDRFILEEPVFDLRVDRQGHRTWDFASLPRHGDGTSNKIAQAGTGTMNDAAGGGVILARAAAGGGTNLAALHQLELGDVRIINGTVRYSDANTATQKTVDKINLLIALHSIASPLRAEGDLLFNGEQVSFDAVLESLKPIVEKKPAKLDATVKSPRFTASFKGTVQAADEMRLDGDVSAGGQSARAFARWLGAELPPSSGFGSFKVDGRLNAEGQVYRLSRANLSLDEAVGTGDVRLATGRARPKLSGELNLSKLDLNAYLPPEDAASAGAVESRGRTTSGGTGSGQSSDPIGDLIGKPGPRVKGYAKRAGWSTDPIDVAPLAALDADLDLTLGELIYRKIKVGRSRMGLTLEDRALTAKLNEMQLYEGTGRGVLTLNARSREPEYGANINLTGVSIQPLLNDAAEIHWLAGTGQFLVAVKSAGDSEQALVTRLGGMVRFAFEDGAVVGVNLPRIVRAIQQGRITDLQGTSTEKTDFTKLDGTLNIENGIASNNDLQMLSPLLRVTGEGKVLLPDRRVDYIVKPKVVASLSGQGGETGLSGIEIPVRVHGPFEDLNYTAQLDDVLKDPGKAADAIRQLGRQFGGEKAGKVLDDILGGGNEETNKKAKKLLDGLFGR
jgi:AsmA protein